MEKTTRVNKKKRLITLSIDFTYNTNAIEGSTITHDETEEIIKRKIAPNKPLSDLQETVNHSKVFLTVLNEKSSLSLRTLLKWHKQLFIDTKPDIAGSLREYSVSVGNYRAPDWQDVKPLLKEFFNWYNKKRPILNPVELASRAHYKFEKIHPFGDGNGRVGRLVIAYILKQNSMPITVIKFKKESPIITHYQNQRSTL